MLLTKLHTLLTVVIVPKRYETTQVTRLRVLFRQVLPRPGRRLFRLYPTFVVVR